VSLYRDQGNADSNHNRQLAVDIARQFNGEVINGDAMQLYEGLPIITNKISPDEMKGVPHHLLGRIGLEEETWTVGRFVQNALGVVCECRKESHMDADVSRLTKFEAEGSFRSW
jgi:hypothetical protein